MKVHPVFHVYLLQLHKKSNLLGQSQSLPPFIEIYNHEKYEMEKLLDTQRRCITLEYLVHWQGYDINEYTWESTMNLVNAL